MGGEAMRHDGQATLHGVVRAMAMGRSGGAAHPMGVAPNETRGDLAAQMIPVAFLMCHARYAMINGVSYTETYAPPLRAALDPSHASWRVGAEAGRVTRQYNIRVLENWMVYN